MNPWVGFNANPRAAAVPWLTEEEFVKEVLFVASTEHKEIFFQLAALANADEGVSQQGIGFDHDSL